MWRASCVLAMLLIGLGGHGPAQATDLRIQLNPALAALHERDPEQAAAALDALLAIIEQRGAAPAEPPRTRGIESPRERELIETNPLLQEAYRIDPKAALDQLREIVAAGGGT